MSDKPVAVLASTVLGTSTSSAVSIALQCCFVLTSLLLVVMDRRLIEKRADRDATRAISVADGHLFIKDTLFFSFRSRSECSMLLILELRYRLIGSIY